ncbi:hypothetical protein [Nonomuraea sp. CA-141351]|uniref:hypothetical protein n=1 Tax=Nonomuraea sp. CA-141351 TaxID=3239996 RepID=UPI003D9453CF
MDLLSADDFRRRRRFERIILIISVLGLVAWVVVSIAPSLIPDPDPGDKDKGLPVKITSAEPDLLTESDVDKAMPPEPGDDASFTTQVLWEIRRGTTRMAGVQGKFSRSSCEGGEIGTVPGNNAKCAIVYEGIKATWSVSIKDVKPYASSGSACVGRPRCDLQFGEIITYDSHPVTGVLLAKAVYGKFWENFHEGSKELRCDKIPRSTSVTVDQPTGFECQYLTLDDDRLRWTTRPVVLTRRGVEFSVP